MLSARGGADVDKFQRRESASAQSPGKAAGGFALRPDPRSPIPGASYVNRRFYYVVCTTALQ